MGTVIRSLYDAKTHLSELVDRAARGEETIIAKNGVAMARLVPLERATGKRMPGGWEGRVWTSDDFDAETDSWTAFEAGAVEPTAPVLRAKAARRGGRASKPKTIAKPSRSRRRS